jgi:hypothetical protein
VAALVGGALGHSRPFGDNGIEPQMQLELAQLPPTAVGAQKVHVEPKVHPCG